MYIITHRGLDPSKKPYFKESSFEAFKDQFERGYGLEFDLQFSKDGVMFAFHDRDLTRFTEGKDTRAIADIDSKELLSMDFSGSHLITISDLLALIESKKGDTLSAIHFKSFMHEKSFIDKFFLEFSKVNPTRFIFFDLKPETALYIKKQNPHASLAASVAHPYDIERYNGAVGGTLLSLSEIIDHKNIFDWAWLDEWDRTAKEAGEKSLYNKETFSVLRKEGIKIALVSPELHATSPGLVGGEAHPDAKNWPTLEVRLREIAALKPDAICTDYPDYVRFLKS